MKRLMASFSLVFLFVACQASGVGHSAYYPGAGDDWERRAPEQVGMDPAALQEAIEFAIANENPASHDLAITLSQSAAWPDRELKNPGERWKYNDVRVNLLALAVLNVWRSIWPHALSELCCDGDTSLPNGATSSAWT